MDGLSGPTAPVTGGDTDESIETDRTYLEHPPLDQTVKPVGDLAQMTDETRTLARAVVFGTSANWHEVQDIINKGERTKAAFQLLTSMTWEDACQTADNADLPGAMDLLRQQAAHHQDTTLGPRGEGWNGPGIGQNAGAAHTFMLSREPSDGEPKLTTEEKKELEEACKTETTTEIDVTRAKLITEATGLAIVTLQPGGPDISRVRLGYFTENLVKKVHRELTSSNSLRKIPLVELAKILSMRMTQSDNFVFEHLGMLVCEDFSTEVGLTKVRGPAQGAQVIKAKKHTWANVLTMEDMTNVVEGLAICAKRPHHSSILDHHEIWALWGKLKQVVTEHGGHGYVPALFLTFKTRIEEHALALRSIAQSEEDSRPLPPLTDLQSESQIVFRDVVQAAQPQRLCGAKAGRRRNSLRRTAQRRSGS